VRHKERAPNDSHLRITNDCRPNGGTPLRPLTKESDQEAAQSEKFRARDYTLQLDLPTPGSNNGRRLPETKTYIKTVFLKAAHSSINKTFDRRFHFLAETAGCLCLHTRVRRYQDNSVQTSGPQTLIRPACPVRTHIYQR